MTIKKRNLQIVSLLLLWLATSFAFGERRRLSPELDAKRARLAAQLSTQAPAELIDVIVQVRPGASLDKHRQKMIGLGAANKSSLGVINGTVFRIPATMLPVLEQDPDITYVSPDRKSIHLSQEDFVLDATQSSGVINAGYTGVGIGVAVIDSGIRVNHPDLMNLNTGYSRVVYSQSFITGLDASDQYGHGTHVAGIIAGNGYVSYGYMQGVASRVNLINLRVLDANGAGTDSAVIAAIQRAIQLKSTYNIRIINLSLGRRVFESYALDPVCQAVEQAWKSGIVVVVAAGNYGQDNSMNTSGYATITAPGNDPYVITVGATNTHATDSTADDTITSFSSKGPTLLDHVIKPDLVAPGNRLVSLLSSGSTLDKGYPANEVNPLLYGSNSNNAYYFRMSGTSMAAPLASGAVALMLERIPSLTPDQVKARLMKTATKTYPANSTSTSASGSSFNSQYDIFTVGSGYLNTYAAVASNELPSGTALSPVAVQDASGNVLLVADSTSVWSNSIVWGTSIVWGNAVNANSIIWGNSIVWGNSSQQGYSIVWGTSIVWGDSVTTVFSEAAESDQN
ncbi:MAG: S8 family peptidase [Acidobacteriia bacterium]|nr:S8 family peptidase [Terriglobia bacterium]